MESYKLIDELKKMFAMMIKGNCSFVDPKKVLSHLLDETKGPIKIGE